MADPPSTAGPVSVPAQMVQHAAASAHSAPAPAGPATTLQHAAAPAQSAPALAGPSTTSGPAAGLVQPVSRTLYFIILIFYFERHVTVGYFT